jgi:hypothetical protein
MHIGIVSESKLVSPSDISWIARACDLQMRKDFAPDWDLTSWPVVVYAKIDDLPHADEVRPIVITDSAADFGTFGYHNFLAGAGYFYGRVFVKPILDNAGGILGDKYINISDVTSHEVLEMRRNPFLADWIRGPVRTVDNKDYCFYAAEVGDPVQRHSYTLTPRLVWGYGKDVKVSNYVRPLYFTERSSISAGTQGPWDKMGVLSGPFSIADGGYLIMRNDVNQRAEVFGSVKPPGWLMLLKHDVGARSKAI